MSPSPYPAFMNEYKNKPWSNINEYFQLGKKYNLWGKDLERALKKDQIRRSIPLPVLRPPRNKT